MLTDKEKAWLIRLARFLAEHGEHCFRLKTGPKTGLRRLVLSFPYGSNLKADLDKDRKNFDYRLNAIFNQKLYDAVLLVVFIEKLFPDQGLVRMIQNVAREDVERELKTI